MDMEKIGQAGRSDSNSIDMRRKRNKAEEALKASEISYRRLFETAQDGILLLDADTGQITDVNPYLIEMLGYSYNEFLGKKLWEIGLFKHIAENQAGFQKLQSEKSIHYENLPLETKGGRHIDVEFVSNVYPVGHKTVIQCNIRDITERKHAEEMIESLAKFPSENSNPVLRIGRDGTLLYVNKAGHTILCDWQLEIDRPAPVVLREAASETLTQEVGKIIDTEHSQQIISFSVVPVVNAGYANFYGQDITERKHAEEELWKYREHLEELVKERTTELAMANEQLQEETTERKLMGQLLRESAERSRFALDVIETGYWDLDLIDHTAQRSLKHDQIFGYETLLPQWTFEMFLEHVVPEDRAAVNQKFQQAIESKGDWNFECRIIRRDGEQRWILAHGRHRLDPSGQLRMMGGIVQDITERRKLEEAHSKLAAIVESADDAMIAEDLEGIIVSWNRGAEIVYGYNAKEIVGKSVSLLMAPSHPDEYIEVLAKIARGETIKHYETQRRRKNGQIIDVSLTISPLKDTSGKIISASIIDRDITEKKKLERGMAQARDVAEATNRELEAFSYSVSHDLRAPLRSIDGFSQALLEDYQDKLDDTAKSYLDRVRKATQYMGRLIDDMLKLSRVTRSGLHHASVDMSTMVREISEKLQQNDPVRTVDVIIREGVFVNGDSNLLKIALENLVNNAWKFTSKEARPQFEFGTTVKEGKTACFIRDNGVGFDMTYVNKLFGAFQRLHTSLEFPGTGIGLATVQRIINRHGGQVWAEAEVGKGATFYFTLPG